LRGSVAARVLFLIELQGLWSVNDLGRNRGRALAKKIIPHVVQRTKRSFIVFFEDMR
jgi:hypothetical protein